jgi:hypothetical protein
VVDLLTVAFLPIAVISIAALILFYLFMLKPKIEEALPNEHDEGLWRVALLQEGMKEGRVCTARRYTQNKFSSLIEAASPEEKPALMVLRDAILRGHIFAQRVGREKLIYHFNLNPLDEQFHMRADIQSRFGMNVPVRVILHIQKCTNHGKSEDGFTYYSVTLRPEAQTLTEEDRKLMKEENTKMAIFMEALKTMKLAASGKEEKKHLEDRVGILETHFNRALEKLNIATTNQAESEIIASTTSLTHPEVPPPSRFHWPKATEFFTGWQVAIAIIAYLVTPNLMAAGGIAYPDRQTVAVGMAFFLFLAFPFVRKLIHR